MSSVDRASSGSIRSLAEQRSLHKSAIGSGSESNLSNSHATFSLDSTEQLQTTVTADNEATQDSQEQQKLLQTTQSLLMASTLMENAMSDMAYQQFGAQLGISTNENMQNNYIKIDVEQLMRENHMLRLRLKEVTYDRDRLLCEISNARLEMSMSELKHLSDDGFPPKAIDRRGSTQCDISAASIDGSGAMHSSLPSTDGSENYVYLQAPCAPPSSMYSNPASTLSDGSQTDIVFHPHLQYSTCHQQKILSHQPLNMAAGGAHYSQHMNACQHHHYRHHHINNGAGAGTVVVAACGGVGAGGRMSPSSLQQNFQKKNNMRNPGDVLKRPRAQTAYELSQDLLEKQIELLERKYGGVRARNAAIIIQRAFRHYMMVKKFASITAMAKQEKRLSRRMLVSTTETGPTSTSSMSSAYGSATESQIDATQQQSAQLQQMQPRITIMAGPPGVAASTGGVATVSTYQTLVSRAPPTRSLSMRERRQGDGSPMPRSQSGSSTTSISSTPCSVSSLMQTHPHVNLLHAAESHIFSGGHPAQATQYYSNYHMVPHENSYSNFGNSSQYEHPLNASWVSASGCSPHTPYYSAAQIYMRPKGATTPADRKKVPPEVPKRTSSISAQQHAHLAAYQQHHQMILLRQTPTPPSTLQRSNGLCKTTENGSLTSVQSSGSDSSITSAERIAHSDISSDRSNSPNTWKRGTNLNSSQQFSQSSDPAFAAMQGMSSAVITVGGAANAGVSVGANVPVDDHTMSSHATAAQYEQQQQQQDQQLNISSTSQNYKVSETLRKRQYRVGLNLFNKKPEKGITYLIRRGFLENTPQGVARFLIARKGLSRKMIGEYLGNLQNQFNMAVLNCFALELDLSDMQVDVALRKFQAYFRMPGEAQKIERLMEVFSQRFCQCNPAIVGRLRSSDTIFVLAFAIIMLNTDLHSPNLKPERRMRVEDFIKNLRGIDDCHDIDREMLAGIYERLKANEFKPGSDHVTQVMKVQATIVGKKPNLALPHRRLVCYCRLYEIPDVNKKERPGVHQREVFLFNDLLVITKIFSKKKSSVTYTFRNSFPLCGMVVTLLNVTNYPYCIQLSQKVDGKILITFNARNEHDRCKFAEDLKESISEMDEMESLRIEAELERQKSARNRVTGSTENRDSGVADVEVCPCPMQAKPSGEAAQCAADAAQQLKRSALSNSLLDMHEQFGNDKPQRRGSVGSLDSGMSISFQSTTATTASRENPALIAAAANAAASKMRFNLQTAVNNSVEGVFLATGVAAYNAAAASNYAHHQQAHSSAAMMQHQHHQQQSAVVPQVCQTQAFAPTHSHATSHATMGHMMTEACEHKLTRSDDNGRATEV